MRFRAVLPGVIILALAAGLAGCGGGNKSTSTAGIPAAVRVAPTSISLNLNSVEALSASVVDANGNAVTTAVTFTFTTSNPALVTVSPSGVVCAGRWDSNFVNCTADSPASVGSAQITVASSGFRSDPVTVFVHPRVTSIRVSPATVNCRSQGQTQQMTAQSFDVNGALIPAELIGPYNWSLGDFTIATIDATTNGLLTAKNPGTTNVFAQLVGTNGITSPPASFTTCPVRSISLHMADSTATSFSIAPAAQQSVVADARDTQGNLLKDITLSFTSTYPSVGSIQTGGTFVALAPGTTSTTAVCAPPSCNPGFAPIYSNVLLATATGDSSTTVYVGGTGTTSLIPIPTSTNTPGTAITLAANPNSMVRATAGSNLYLGSSGGLITVNMDSNTASTTASVTGTALAVSPSGNTVVASDITANKVFELSGTTATSIEIAGATRAVYSPDGNKLFIVTNNGLLFVFSLTAPQRTISLGATAKDVGVLAASWFTYLAEPGAIAVRATCDNSSQGTASGTVASPTLLLAKPDGTGMLAADPPSVDVITANSSGAGCPPAGNSSVTAHNLGLGDFTVHQMFMLADGSKAYIIAEDGRLIAYDVDANTASVVSLGGVNALSGGATLDSKTLYIGASDNKVHIIDVATATDKQQITLDPAFTPDLLVVRAK